MNSRARWLMSETASEATTQLAMVQNAQLKQCTHTWTRQRWRHWIVPLVQMLPRILHAFIQTSVSYHHCRRAHLWDTTVRSYVRLLVTVCATELMNHLYDGWSESVSFRFFQVQGTNLATVRQSRASWHHIRVSEVQKISAERRRRSKLLVSCKQTRRTTVHSTPLLHT